MFPGSVGTFNLPMPLYIMRMVAIILEASGITCPLVLITTKGKLEELIPGTSEKLVLKRKIKISVEVILESIGLRSQKTSSIVK